MEIADSVADIYILRGLSFFRDLFNWPRYEKETHNKVWPHLCFSQNYTHIVLNREYVATNCRRISTSFHNYVHSCRNSAYVISYEVPCFHFYGPMSSDALRSVKLQLYPVWQLYAGNYQLSCRIETSRIMLGEIYTRNP